MTSYYKTRAVGPTVVPQPMIYYCEVCKKFWERRAVSISCMVMHLPGTCCHYRETEIKTGVTNGNDEEATKQS